MLESSVRLGTIAGIRIGVHYTWFIVFLLISSSLYMLFVDRHPDWSPSLALATAAITSVLFFASIILHELGHSIVAITRGIRVRSITLFIFGGVAQSEKDSDSPATEFLVAIAGPLVSLCLAVLFFVLKLLVGDYSEAAAEALAWLATINLIVAVFNLVPGFPLDGGRVFRALVWWLTGDNTKGMRWAVAAGKIVAYGLMGLGVLIVLQTGLLLNGVWMFGIGWFLLIAAQASSQAFTLHRVFRGLRVSEVMETEVPAVAGDVSIADWIDQYVLTRGQRAFLVLDGEQTVGLVTLSDSRKVPRERWPTVPVREVMTPLTRLHTVTPDTDTVKTLELMGRHSLNQVPVVEDGAVVGWIDRMRLIRILQLYVETGR